MSTLVTAIDPSRASLAQFVADAPADQPLSMLNLLRFREQAAYSAELSAAPCSGRQAYAEYTRQVLPLLDAVGAAVLWQGQVHCALIAPPGEEWHSALLVQYPSKQAFVQMIHSAAYRAIVHHRTAALADSRLLATVAPATLE